MIAKISLVGVCVVLIALLVGGAGGAGASKTSLVTPIKTQSTFEINIPDEIPTSLLGASVSVVDYDTGQVLLGIDADTKRPIASITKLIVAAAISISNKLISTTTITDFDTSAPEDFGKLETGQIYTVRELLFPYLLESSNDAGFALDRELGDEIHQSVLALLDDANVATDISLFDATGLSVNNNSSAISLARLSRYLKNNHPYVYDITKLPKYKNAYTGLVNNNPLVTLASFEGGKHGYTVESGKTIVAHIKTDISGIERELVYVILGVDNIEQAFFDVQSLVQANVKFIPSNATSSVIITTSDHP